MYKIDVLPQQVLDSHYAQYGQVVRDLIIKVKNGLEIPYSFGRTHVERVVFKVHNGSYTYRFLEKYSNEDNLRMLLCGNYEHLIEILREVSAGIPNAEWKNRATKEKYENNEYDVWGVNADGLKQIDHFNEIMRWIFIDQMYDGKNEIAPFNKRPYIQDIGLVVCPYCGRNYIETEEETGYQDDNPPIDHYLPKSKYPFLALSCYNMIPCCTQCNKLSNKGENDPLSDAIPTNTYLLNPHVFYDNAISFAHAYNDRGMMDERNFKVMMNTANDDLQTGYFGWLKLHSFYGKRNSRVQEIYSEVTTYSEEEGNFLKKEGLPQEYLDDIAARTIGFRLDGKASKRPLYKFNKEILISVLKSFGMNL